MTTSTGARHELASPRRRNDGAAFEFLELDPADSLWLAGVATAEHDIYHRPSYSKLEAGRTGHRAAAGYVSWATGAMLVPYLVRSIEGTDLSDLVSPYGYSGALLLGESDASTRSGAVQALWNGLREAGYCSAFLRLHPLLTAAHDAFAPEDLHLTGEVVVVDLTKAPEDIWTGMRKEARRVVRRSREAGISVEFCEAGATALREFSEIYIETMRRVGAADLYYTLDHDYFRALSRGLGEDLELSVATAGDSVLCSGLWSQSAGIVQSLLGGTRTDALRLQPNVIETYAGILHYREMGAKMLNLGGGVGAQRDSLFRFKRSFSPDTRAFHSVRKVLDEATYKALTLERARAIGTTAEQLASIGYFPAYRATA